MHGNAASNITENDIQSGHQSVLADYVAAKLYDLCMHMQHQFECKCMSIAITVRRQTGQRTAAVGLWHATLPQVARGFENDISYVPGTQVTAGHMPK